MGTTQTTKSTSHKAPKGEVIEASPSKRQSPGEIGKRLERLRDQVRLDLHLARMDAKDRLRELEPQLHHAEKLATHVTEISIRALGQIAAEVRRFQEHLKQHWPRA